MPGTNEFGQPVGSPLDPIDVPLPGQIELLGSYCSLRRMDSARDAASLYKQFVNAPATTWTYLPYGPFESEQGFTKWLTRQTSSEDPAFFTIFAGADPVGLASFLRITAMFGVIEVGHIHFGPAMQRTRVATEAMYLMMKWAFENGYRRYEWKCDSLNGPSRSAALRFGFQFEGLFRQHLFYKGRNRDTAWFSIIDTEWPAIRDEFERWLDPANFDETAQQLSSLAMPERQRLLVSDS